LPVQLAADGNGSGGGAVVDGVGVEGADAVDIAGRALGGAGIADDFGRFAVGPEGVQAALSPDGVALPAADGHDRVVSVAAPDHVVAPAGVDSVIAVAAVDLVRPGATKQHVVA